MANRIYDKSLADLTPVPEVIPEQHAGISNMRYLHDNHDEMLIVFGSFMLFFGALLWYATAQALRRPMKTPSRDLSVWKHTMRNEIG